MYTTPIQEQKTSPKYTAKISAYSEMLDRALAKAIVRACLGLDYSSVIAEAKLLAQLIEFREGRRPK
jgi:hypothetical protein